MLTLKKLLFQLQQLDEEQLKQPVLFHSPYFDRTHPIAAFGEIKEEGQNRAVLALLGNNFN